jgi:hypothetical protein
MHDLKDVFTHTTPLGPLMAPKGLDASGISRALFDNETDLVRQFNERKNIIVGRKGAGKTSLLTSVALSNERCIAVYLDDIEAANVLTEILSEISDLSADIAFVEQTAKLWEFLFWGLVIVRIVVEYGDQTLERYLAACGIGRADYAKSPYVLISRQLQMARHLPPESRPLALKIRYYEFDGLNFIEAKARALVVLERHDVKAYVLIDSLESYQLDSMKHATALAGLLRCIGESTYDGDRCLFRCCLPAEIYHDIMRMSSNPLKDFGGQLLMHWDAIDLWQLCARRYNEFLRIHAPEVHERINRERLEFNRRKDVFEFWSKILPTDIVNDTGHKEKTVAYLTRHTQLLPRHLIHILNEITSLSVKSASTVEAISAEVVKRGLGVAEAGIKDQIEQAYSFHSPRVGDMCNLLLRELKTKFTWQEFDRVFGTITKKFGERKSGRKSGAEVIDILIEIGAVGRFVEETENYNIAIFDYMVPNRVVASLRNEFCVHPVFAGAYNSDARYPGAKPIYAYWSREIPRELA